MLEIGRNKELSQKQATEISENRQLETTDKEFVNKFNQNRSHSNQQLQTRPSSNRNQSNMTCFKYGGTFSSDHQKSCVAIGRVCYNCGKMNHLSNVCRSSKPTDTARNRQVRNINDNNSDSENDDLAHSFALFFQTEHVKILDETIEPVKSTKVSLKINDVQTNTIGSSLLT